ncbi:Uncharacterised protein [Achromobacter sp. 2789STDY5608621]|nr:Uncharacterised protein [Achromobacter sp. 2789STDY5608621]
MPPPFLVRLPPPEITPPKLPSSPVAWLNTRLVPVAVPMAPVRLWVSPIRVPPASVVPPLYWFWPLSVSVPAPDLVRLPAPVMLPASVRSLAPDTVSAAPRLTRLASATPGAPACRVLAPVTDRPPLPSAVLPPATSVPPARVVPPV